MKRTRMMFIYSDDLSDGATIDPLFAFGKKQPDEHMAFSDNLNPHLAWRQIPQATPSLVLTCVDPDVPQVADEVNQEGKVLPVSMPRVDFFHWVMVDIPATVQEIKKASCSNGVVGKIGPVPTGCGPNGSMLCCSSLNWNDQITLLAPCLVPFGPATQRLGKC